LPAAVTALSHHAKTVRGGDPTVDGALLFLSYGE